MTCDRSRSTLFAMSGRGLTALVAALGMTMAPLGAAASASTTRSQMSAVTAKSKIIADWEAFFSGKTPASRKVQLVEDGSAFSKVIKAQAGGGMAQSVTATVSKVTLNKSMTEAAVVYTIDLGGSPALKNQTGTAVYQGGVWKVGAASFCALLGLEGSASQVSVCKVK
ncbi:MAG TPA: hypothetical protein VME20_13545 [Acidimicrobiales bacterium]|nr:hypothetical protein [Acidimicrobiales bacterium]